MTAWMTLRGGERVKEYFSIKQAANSVDIYIFGDIVPYEFAESDVSGYGLVRRIQSLNAELINVHIDSYGGAVSEGWAIYNALREHPARVETYADGFVASAALYPFLAGESRYASPLSAFFLHFVSTEAEGYAEDLRAAADDIETMTEIGISAFVERAGMDAAEVRHLMEDETWLTPEQARRYGIATTITNDRREGYAQSARQNIIKKLTQKAETGSRSVNKIFNLLGGL